jgi:hypothetical protein
MRTARRTSRRRKASRMLDMYTVAWLARRFAWVARDGRRRGIARRSRART